MYATYTDTLKANAKTNARTIEARLQPVEVSSSRLVSGIEEATAPVTVVDAAYIRLLGARQSAEVLSFVPGVFVRNYGGVGGLKTISLRGASAAQTAVFMDGVRLSSTQNGQFDMSGIPAAMLERVEVVRGGAGALFGAGSMAGAVNMRTRTRIAAPELSAVAECASFEEYRALLTGGLPLSSDGALGIIGHVEAQKARGNYPFPFNEFGRDTVLQRSNADALLAAASLLGFAQMGRWHLSSRIMARLSGRGTPGAVVQGSVEMAEARLNEEDLLASVSAHNAFTTQSLFSITGSARWNTLHYRDPNARQFGTNGINERFWANDILLNAKLRFQESIKPPFMSVAHEWLLETTFSELTGNMLQTGVGNRVRRTGIGFGAKGEARMQLPINSAEMLLNAAVRLDSFSDVGSAISPLLGSALHLDSLWILRVQWSYSFRPPSFNELYYLNFGNASLLPERAHSFNVGASYRIPASVFSLSADVFYHRISNQILAVQTSPFTVSAQNIDDVQSFGCEASLHAALWEYVSVRASYTLQRVTNQTPGAFTEGKQLVYTPQHLASCALEYAPSWFRAGMTAHVIGDRYFLPSNTPGGLLPAFATMNIFAQASIALTTVISSGSASGFLSEIRVRLACENCFDEHYAIIRNFPMPGRSVRLTLEMR